MEPLNGHLSKMQLNAEISELIISNFPVIVSIIPKDILGHVYQFNFILF